MKSIHFVILFFCLAILTSCEDKDQSSRTTFGIFKVLDDQTIEMNGVIRSNTLKKFDKLIKAYPNIEQINIQECGGSADDEVNLELSKKVHELGINTHLLDNGLIASGGVDFFLAGIKRSKGLNTQIGVHSWAGDGQTATDFEEGHAYHQPYINYYQAVGFSQQAAQDFYYFTINAAPADDIHWMTDQEIEQYGILKD